MSATESISLLMISANEAEIEWVSQLCERAANDIAFFSAGDVTAATTVMPAKQTNVALLALGHRNGATDPKTVQMIDDLGRSAPVIVITDSADIDIEQAFIDNGVVDVLHRQELTPSGLRR